MTTQKPTLDAATLAALKAMGIDPNTPAQWVQTQPVNAADLPAVQDQRALLAKLRDALKIQLNEDTTRLDLAHEELERLKNGGGL